MKMNLTKGDKVRIKEDAPVDPIVLKDACITAWNDDSVEIDLRGQIGEVISTASYQQTIWVCLEVTIAGCIKVRTYQPARTPWLERVWDA